MRVGEVHHAEDQPRRAHRHDVAEPAPQRLKREPAEQQLFTNPRRGERDELADGRQRRPLAVEAQFLSADERRHDTRDDDRQRATREAEPELSQRTRVLEAGELTVRLPAHRRRDQTGDQGGQGEEEESPLDFSCATEARELDGQERSELDQARDDRERDDDPPAANATVD